MVVNIECALNDLQFDEKMNNVLNTYNKYINYRFNYVIRASMNEVPPELEYDVDREFKPEVIFINFSVMLCYCFRKNLNEYALKLLNFISSSFLLSDGFLFIIT